MCISTLLKGDMDWLTVGVGGLFVKDLQCNLLHKNATDLLRLSPEVTQSEASLYGGH